METLRKKETITSKERVQKAIVGEKQDRVPINYLYNPGINKKLLKYFGLKNNQIDLLHKILGVDFTCNYPRYAGKQYHKQVSNDKKRVNSFGMIETYIENTTGGYWEVIDFPLQDADYETVLNWGIPTADDYDFSNIEEQYKNNPDNLAQYFGHSAIGCMMNTAGSIRGMEQMFIDLITDDPAGLLLMDKLLEHDLGILERTLDKAHKYIDFVWMGEDLGTQHTQLIGRNIFEKHIFPRHKKVLDIANSYNVPVMLHCFGSSSWAFEDYIAAGLKGVDTLQPEAKNMDPEYLVENFSGRLFFHGCISTAEPLTNGSEEDVIKNVKDTLDIMMPTKSYMLAPTHQIQDNTPVENVVAMYKAVHEYGRY